MPNDPAIEAAARNMTMMEKLNRWLFSRQPKRTYEWPDCEPGTCGSVNFGSGQYSAKEVSPGRWQWVYDEEANAWINQMQSRRRELFWALRTRVLTNEEMAEALEHGDSLNIENMVPYTAAEKSRELNEAYYQQARLRSLAAQPGDRTAKEMREGAEG